MNEVKLNEVSSEEFNEAVLYVDLLLAQESVDGISYWHNTEAEKVFHMSWGVDPSEIEFASRFFGCKLVQLSNGNPILLEEERERLGKLVVMPDVVRSLNTTIRFIKERQTYVENGVMSEGPDPSDNEMDEAMLCLDLMMIADGTDQLNDPIFQARQYFCGDAYMRNQADKIVGYLEEKVDALTADSELYEKEQAKIHGAFKMPDILRSLQTMVTVLNNENNLYEDDESEEQAA